MAYEWTDPWHRIENLKTCMTAQENFQQETMQVPEESFDVKKLQAGKTCSKVCKETTSGKNLQ